MTQITRNVFLFASISQGGEHLHSHITEHLAEIVTPSVVTAVFFLEQIKHIHLFGNCTPEKKQVICSTVSGFDVIASFEGDM